MRTLYVSKYLAYWSVRYLRNGQHPGWPLSSLSIKTHGLINFQDLLFDTEEQALEYAYQVADSINFLYEQPYCNILIDSPGKITRNIEYKKSEPIDLTQVDFKPPSTEINQFGRIKHKA